MPSELRRPWKEDGHLAMEQKGPAGAMLASTAFRRLQYAVVCVSVLSNVGPLLQVPDLQF